MSGCAMLYLPTRALLIHVELCGTHLSRAENLIRGESRFEPEDRNADAGWPPALGQRRVCRRRRQMCMRQNSYPPLDQAKRHQGALFGGGCTAVLGTLTK